MGAIMANGVRFEITYYQPNLGSHRYFVATREALAPEMAWLDAAGHMYRVREITGR